MANDSFHRTMPISDKYQAVFIHIPKNAGTSLEKALEARETGHKPWTYYTRKFPEEWNSYKSFAVIRDPVDRFVSSYNYARSKKSYWHSSIPGDKSIYGKHPDYEICSTLSIGEVLSLHLRNPKILRHGGWSSQFAWINNNGSVAVDWLVDFSRLNEAIPEIARGITMQFLNKSERNEAAEIDSAGISMLRQVYQADFRLMKLLENSTQGYIAISK